MTTSYDGSTLRENLFGIGQQRLAADHPGTACTTSPTSQAQ